MVIVGFVVIGKNSQWKDRGGGGDSVGDGKERR